MKATLDIEWDTKGGEYALPTSPDQVHCISIKPFGEDPFTLIQPYVAQVRHELKQLEVIIGHNILGADFPALMSAYGISFTLVPDTIDGNPSGFIDTLVLSRYSNPDRMLPAGMPTKHGGRAIGPHSLAAWAWRVGMYKPEIEDWRDLPMERYVERCEEDTRITEATYRAIMQEIRD